VRLPLVERALPLTPVPVTVTDVAFWVVQLRTTGAPEAGEEAGLAENVRI
jgi:hypothetical protein